MEGNYRLVWTDINSVTGELNVPRGWRVKQVVDTNEGMSKAYVLIERIER